MPRDVHGGYGQGGSLYKALTCLKRLPEHSCLYTAAPFLLFLSLSLGAASAFAALLRFFSFTAVVFLAHTLFLGNLGPVWMQADLFRLIAPEVLAGSIFGVLPALEDFACLACRFANIIYFWCV